MLENMSKSQNSAVKERVFELIAGKSDNSLKVDWNFN